LSADGKNDRGGEEEDYQDDQEHDCISAHSHPTLSNLLRNTTNTTNVKYYQYLDGLATQARADE
jgi:hypothetical protein